MSPMRDPKEVWKNSALAEGISKESVFRRKYELPDIKDDKDRNIFQWILEYICKGCEDSWIKGFIDLDQEWREFKDPVLEQMRQKLFENYPSPFKGRKAYLAQIQVTEFESNVFDDKGVQIFEKVNDKNGKPILDEDGKEKLEPKKKNMIGILKQYSNFSYMLETQICVFHNSALGWNKENKETLVRKFDAETGTSKIIKKDEKKTNPNEKEQYKFVKVNIFLRDKELIKKIEGFTQDALNEDANVPQILFVFLIGGEITETEKNGYKNKNLELDDII